MHIHTSMHMYVLIYHTYICIHVYNSYRHRLGPKGFPSGGQFYKAGTLWPKL